MVDHLLSTGMWTYLVLLSSFLGSCLPFEIMDQLGIYESKKIQPSSIVSPHLKRKAFYMVAFNFVWLLAMLHFVSPLLEALLDIESKTPTISTFLWQISLAFVIDDFWFYCYHRYLHTNKQLYVFIHKPHHGKYVFIIYIFKSVSHVSKSLYRTLFLDKSRGSSTGNDASKCWDYVSAVTIANAYSCLLDMACYQTVSGSS